MDVFAGIVGHDRVLRLLGSQLRTGRLSHAYLFTGEPGLGKATVARRFATGLLPEVALSRHPDYWEDDRIRSISIDEVRLLPDKQPEFHAESLQAFLALKPAVGSRRVALIANVGRLKDEVQGILLKTLEEPHPGRVVILTSPNTSPFVVLPTVVSRCQRVAFQQVPLAEVERMLVEHGVSSEAAAELAVLSRGRPGWALQAAADPNVVRRHRRWTQEFERVLAAPADASLQVAAELDADNFAWRSGDRSSEEPVVSALGSWQLHIRERMLREQRPQRWARMLELSFDTLGYLEQNVSPRLALECFLLECRRLS
jgi:DNA polymerase-3 subunit delta'